MESSPRRKAPWAGGPPSPSRGIVESGPVGGSRASGIAGGRASRKRARPVGASTMRVMRIGRERLLQPFSSRACDRRCPGYEDRGKEPGGEQSPKGSLGSAKAASGPLTRGSSAGQVPQGARPPGKANCEGNLVSRWNGAREIPVVLVDRADCRRRRSASFLGQRKLPRGARGRGQAL